MLNIMKYAHIIATGAGEEGFYDRGEVTYGMVFDQVVKKSTWKKSIGEDIRLDEEELTEVLHAAIQDYTDSVLIKFMEMGLIESSVNAKGEMTVKITEKGIETVHFNNKHNESKGNLSNEANQH